mgnify:FL=1
MPSHLRNSPTVQVIPVNAVPPALAKTKELAVIPTPPTEGILFMPKPVSTCKVPVVVIGPPVRPKPAATLVTLPVEGV